MLIALLFLLSCQQSDNKQNTVSENPESLVTKKSQIEETNLKNELKGSINYEDSLFNYLFVINYYDRLNDQNKSKNLTLIENAVDTSFFFNFQLRTNKFSRKIQKFAKEIKLHSTKKYVARRLFYLEDVKSINDSLYLGIFIEYFGFERICYAYGQMKISNGDYLIERLYSRLDVTGIGAIKYDMPKILDNSGFYIVGDNQGEGHQSVAIHYFPNDFNNKTSVLEKCSPSAEANPHNERLVYTVDYEKNTIEIKKYEIDTDKEKNWRFIFEKEYSIIDILANGQK